jgi:hypothetical protein
VVQICASYRGELAAFERNSLSDKAFTNTPVFRAETGPSGTVSSTNRGTEPAPSTQLTTAQVLSVPGRRELDREGGARIEKSV